MSDRRSRISAVSRASGNPVLRWGELQDGMVGKAENSIQHPVVSALTSVVSYVAPGSALLRDLDRLPDNRGKFRPFIVVRKPRGHAYPARIVLCTHFDGRPIAEVDEASRTLAVALGSVTPPHPLPTSPRIQIAPAWTEENSYAIAFAINLLPGRHPKRYRTADGEDYAVVTAELDTLRAVCDQRTLALESMSPEDLEAIKSSYEEYSKASRAGGSRRGSQFFGGRSVVTDLAPIREEERARAVGAHAPPPAQVDEDGFTQVQSRRRIWGSRTSNSRR